MSGLTIAQKMQRLGYFSASSVEALLKPKGFGDGGMTYIRKKAAERLTGEVQPTITTPAMQWGNDNESLALEEINKLYGLELLKNDTVFVEDGLNLAGTPDCVGNDFGIEIKCPNSDTHLLYREMLTSEDLKKIEPKYYWQCLAYMLLTANYKWTFASFDPRFKNNKLFLLKIEPNVSDFTFLAERLLDAKIIYDKILNYEN